MVSATFTEDSDSLLFGSNKVIWNFGDFLAGWASLEICEAS